jgi:cytidylate kinase
MLRKVTKAVGRLRVGDALDYPVGVWRKIAQDSGMALDEFTRVVESNAVLQSALKGRVKIHRREGASV